MIRVYKGAIDRDEFRLSRVVGRIIVKKIYLQAKVDSYVQQRLDACLKVLDR